MIPGMMPLQTLLWFIGAELVFSASPGPAAMLVSAYGFRGGFRTALLANAGIQSGNAIYLLVSALGLGALIATSGLAFDIITGLGAAYLVILGARTIWRAGAAAPDRPSLLGKPYVQALLTQLGNPKAVLFFGAFLPQFLDPHAPLAPQYGEMFVIVMIGETVILGLYGWLGAQGARLAGGRFAIWRDRIGGAVLIAIGAIFAAAHRA
jgi:homoserine/homoserine lactone efflux protein